MERINYAENYSPSIGEIFDALTDYETSGDWDSFILAKANPNDLEKVKEVLDNGWPLSESANYLGILR